MDENLSIQNPQINEEEIAEIGIENGSRVILFNDNIHTFDEVISQLIKAIGCDLKKAEKFANEIHTKGKACVFVGEINRSIIVSHILEEIGLHTQIEI